VAKFGLVATLQHSKTIATYCSHGRDVGRRRRILSPANFVGVRAHEEPSAWDEAEVVEVVELLFHCNGEHLKKNKGPDNPTCQLLPASSKRKVKIAWGKQEREKRW